MLVACRLEMDVADEGASLGLGGNGYADPQRLVLASFQVEARGQRQQRIRPTSCTRTGRVGGPVDIDIVDLQDLYRGGGNAGALRADQIPGPDMKP